MSATERQMRADARRNREAILDAAGELFAARGAEVQMDEIAERAALGMGTLYRHFPTKQALFSAIVAARFWAMAELARDAAQIDEPGQAFDTLLRTYLEAAERDAAFRLAVLGPEPPDWVELADEKRAFSEAATPTIQRAVAAGHVRDDFAMADFVLVTRGIMVNMTAGGSWRRHLQLALEGLR